MDRSTPICAYSRNVFGHPASHFNGAKLWIQVSVVDVLLLAIFVLPILLHKLGQNRYIGCSRNGKLTVEVLFNKRHKYQNYYVSSTKFLWHCFFSTKIITKCFQQTGLTFYYSVIDTWINWFFQRLYRFKSHLLARSKNDWYRFDEAIHCRPFA